LNSTHEEWREGRREKGRENEVDQERQAAAMYAIQMMNGDIQE
jgi:hypothetical protein